MFFPTRARSPTLFHHDHGQANTQAIHRVSSVPKVYRTVEGHWARLRNWRYARNDPEDYSPGPFRVIPVLALRAEPEIYPSIVITIRRPAED
jgi:hypothetical protein